MVYIFKSNYLSLEISHGSFSKKNFFSFIIFDNNNNKNLLKKKISNRFRIFKYLIIFYQILLFRINNNYNFKTLLCIDPISSLLGFFLKNNKNDKLIFHITDYSKKRFVNIILNFIYQIIFRLSLKFSDLVTSPSKKLIKKFNRRIFYIPNTPSIRLTKINNNKKNYVLMLIPKIDDGINLKIILD